MTTFDKIDIENLNDDSFYKKNPNEEKYYVIPISLLKDEFESSKYKCIICSNLSINPIKCKDCKSISCSNCLERPIFSDFVCPSTKSSHNFENLDTESKIFFENISVQCPSKDSNCKEVIEIKNLKYHLENCKFWIGTFCCVGCGKYDLIEDIECHVLVCDQITWNCNFCNKLYKRADLSSHMEICDMKTVECTKCHSNFQNKDYENHYSKDECLFAVVMDIKKQFNGNR